MATSRTKRIEPPKKPARGPAVLIVTWDGVEIQRIVGPPNANDVRFGWSPPMGSGGGFFTRNGKPLPNSAFCICAGNDYHFSPTGQFGPGTPPLIPPPGTNDIEFEWDEKKGVIVAGWWTRDGKRIEPIPLEDDPTAFSFMREAAEPEP